MLIHHFDVSIDKNQQRKKKNGSVLPLVASLELVGVETELSKREKIAIGGIGGIRVTAGGALHLSSSFAGAVDHLENLWLGRIERRLMKDGLQLRLAGSFAESSRRTALRLGTVQAAAPHFVQLPNKQTRRNRNESIQLHVLATTEMNSNQFSSPFRPSPINLNKSVDNTRPSIE